MPYQASSKGQGGEIRVALAINSLDRSIYHAIHNVTLPGEDGTTQIDHVVISKHGIFVVETKNYSGWIFGNERQKEWTWGKFGSKVRFQNPLRQNYRHIKVLSGFLGLSEDKFHSVVAFCGESEFKTAMPSNVLSSGYGEYITSKQDIHLDDDEVSRHVEKLKVGMLPRGDETDRIHVESLKQRHGKSEQPINTKERLNTDDHSKLCIRLPRTETPPDSTDHAQQDASVWQGHTSERVIDIRNRKPLSSKNRSGAILLIGAILAVILISALGSLFKPADLPITQPRVVSYRPSSLPQSPQTVTPPPQREVANQIAPNVGTRFESGELRAVQVSESEAKEMAWQRWYKRSPSCEGENADVVKCGNHFIVAKREFERKYALGMLK